MQFWDELEGKSLAGTYPLNRWLRTEGNAAWFATRYQDKPAIAYMVDMAGDDDPVVASLEAVSRVQHPNIVQIDRVGRAGLEGRAVAYAIQEPTEDNLSDALRERPLTTEETTQIAESLVGGLGALHAAGLIHGQVMATTVLAVGDTVKLRSDCVRKAAASDKAKPGAYAQDVYDMGSLLFECLTQRKLVGPDDPTIAKLPAPFGEIVQKTAAGRWGLEDVATSLRKPTVSAPVASVAAKIAPAVSVASASVPSAKTVSIPAAKPAAAVPPVQPAAFIEDQPAKNLSGVRIVALVAIVLLLGAVWYFLRGSHAKHATPDGTTASNAAPSASETTAAPTPATPAPQAAAPVAPPTPMPLAAGQHRAVDHASQTAAEAAASGHKVWRVVVFTYGDQAKAQQRVAIILGQHPDLKPEVFTATGHGPYLVTVGGPMDHDEAIKLRSHARGEGMAHDAYIQNYTH